LLIKLGIHNLIIENNIHNLIFLKNYDIIFIES